MLCCMVGGGGVVSVLACALAFVHAWHSYFVYVRILLNGPLSHGLCDAWAKCVNAPPPPNSVPKIARLLALALHP